MKTKNESEKQVPIWLAGIAATAASAGSSNAAVVQITFDNVGLTPSSNTLITDLTGDGLSEIVIGSINQSSNLASLSFYPLEGVFYGIARAGIGLGGLFSGSIYQGPSATIFASGTSSAMLIGSLELSFSDIGINDGEITGASLEIAVSASEGDFRVAFTRLVFNDDGGAIEGGFTPGGPAFPEFTRVPEPSALALLALGAAGIVTRRQRKK